MDHFRTLLCSECVAIKEPVALLVLHGGNDIEISPNEQETKLLLNCDIA
jgi:hypothetical protein